ncbi:hypothetical protein NKG94_10020 [Micromonospora sp. M12]
MLVDKPANYGWPYCVTPTIAYRDYDFATGESGAKFNCKRPVNDSPHNTGKRVLPPVEQPEVWYASAASAEFPQLGTGGIARWAARRTSTTGRARRVPAGRPTTTGCRCSTSGPATTSRSSASTRTAT